MHDYFSMGGYAAQVWPTCAVAIAILLWSVIGPLRRERRLRAMIRRLQGRQQRRGA